MKVAVIGGGINGVMSAWALCRQGAEVSLFERGELMNETSAASSRMLHGGIRYLEHGHFSLVREALRERAWWRAQAPHLTTQIPLLIPVYRHGARARWVLGLGVRLYDFLARGSGFPRARWHDAASVRARLPQLASEGLLGAWEYWDGLMDDRALGLWAAQQLAAAGAVIHTGVAVSRVTPQGEVGAFGARLTFDCVVNAAGPWAGQLLAQSGVSTRYALTLIRGSHILIDRPLGCGCVLQDPASRRVVFVLPAGAHTLLGTTEVPQSAPQPTAPSAEEIGYLKDAYQRAFSPALAPGEIVQMFAGVRPVVKQHGHFSSASREALIEVQGRLITVWGGKWTTSRALGEKVARAAKR